MIHRELNEWLGYSPPSRDTLGDLSSTTVGDSPSTIKAGNTVLSLRYQDGQVYVSSTGLIPRKLQDLLVWMVPEGGLVLAREGARVAYELVSIHPIAKARPEPWRLSQQAGRTAPEIKVVVADPSRELGEAGVLFIRIHQRLALLNPRARPSLRSAKKAYPVGWVGSLPSSAEPTESGISTQKPQTILLEHVRNAWVSTACESIQSNFTTCS